MDALTKAETISSSNPQRFASAEYRRATPPARDPMRHAVDPDFRAGQNERISKTDLVFSIFVGLVAWLALVWAVRAAVLILG